MTDVRTYGRTESERYNSERAREGMERWRKRKRKRGSDGERYNNWSSVFLITTVFIFNFLMPIVL